MTDEINSETYVKDVTDDIEQIYAKLARPLQDLENMEYEYGDKKLISNSFLKIMRQH